MMEYSLRTHALCACVFLFSVLDPSRSESSKPNIIVFLADDLGYGDLHSFGHATQEKGEIDTMVDEGLKFTQWTSAALICSPSRAALLTGRYAVRSGIYGRDDKSVFSPFSSGGLPRSETTMAESLKDLGYKTGMVGKWHLGINRASSDDGFHLPGNHGFDFVGTNLPLSQARGCDPDLYSVASMNKLCFLYNGSSIVEQPINHGTLTRRLVEDSLNFIRSNKEGPFFLYFSFPQVHSAMFCDETLSCGKSTRGDYGDNINEMAWAVGQVLSETRTLNIEEDTLAIFTSDHGAHRSCQLGTSNGPLQGGKSSTWEGGFRVPAVAWWPGTIQPGTSENMVNTMDILPTALHLAGSPDYLTSKNIIVDGQVIPEIVNTGTTREVSFYYCSDRIMAVRYKQYKIHYHTMGMPESGSLGGCSNSGADIGSDYACNGADIVSWNPALVFDLSDNEGEDYSKALDNDLQSTKDIISAVDLLKQQHVSTVPTQIRSQLNRAGGSNLRPCCDPGGNPTCTCNYNP